MAKYIVQLRRGTKKEWEAYEKSEDYEKPRAGELVIEYEDIYDGDGNIKRIPRLKIGDGVADYSQLPYMSVDSFIMPKPTTITLYGGDAWTKVSEEQYTQNITEQLAGKITINSKIDLQPTPQLLCTFRQNDVTFTAINKEGNVTVHAIGVRPEQDYEDIQVTITEVALNG